jgi:hypothetical protein
VRLRLLVAFVAVIPLLAVFLAVFPAQTRTQAWLALAAGSDGIGPLEVLANEANARSAWRESQAYYRAELERLPERPGLAAALSIVLANDLACDEAATWLERAEALLVAQPRSHGRQNVESARKALEICRSQ